jgi:DNA-directed RNA polymerase specialized sigma24 family protein
MGQAWMVAEGLGLPHSWRAAAVTALSSPRRSAPPATAVDRATVTSGMSREVRTLYDARIERLPEPTRHLLLLAVLDGSADLGVGGERAGRTR